MLWFFTDLKHQSGHSSQEAKGRIESEKRHKGRKRKQIKKIKEQETKQQRKEKNHSE